MKIAIGCDHGAFELKNAIADHLRAKGFEVDDIAKATGLGIGAVHLIRQMEARQAASREKEG